MVLLPPTCDLEAMDVAAELVMVSSRSNFFMYVKVGVSEDDAERGAGASFEGDCAPVDAEPTQTCLWRLACLAQSVSDSTARW